MKWKTEYKCISCDNVLTFHEKMNNFGRCPYCGFKDSFACTIVKTSERGYCMIRTGSWWKFWEWERIRKLE